MVRTSVKRRSMASIMFMLRSTLPPLPHSKRRLQAERTRKGEH